MKYIKLENITRCMLDKQNAERALRHELALEEGAAGPSISGAEPCEEGFRAALLLPDGFEAERAGSKLLFRCDAFGTFICWDERGAKSVYRPYQYPGQLLFSYADGSWALGASGEKPRTVDARWARRAEKEKLA